MAVSNMVRGAELIIMVMVVVCVSQARADTGHATFYGGMDGRGTMGEWNSIANFSAGRCVESIAFDSCYHLDVLVVDSCEFVRAEASSRSAL